MQTREQLDLLTDSKQRSSRLLRKVDSGRLEVYRQEKEIDGFREGERQLRARVRGLQESLHRQRDQHHILMDGKDREVASSLRQAEDRRRDLRGLQTEHDAAVEALEETKFAAQQAQASRDRLQDEAHVARAEAARLQAETDKLLVALKRERLQAKRSAAEVERLGAADRTCEELRADAANAAALLQAATDSAAAAKAEVRQLHRVADELRAETSHRQQLELELAHLKQASATAASVARDQCADHERSVSRASVLETQSVHLRRKLAAEEAARAVVTAQLEKAQHEQTSSDSEATWAADVASLRARLSACEGENAGLAAQHDGALADVVALRSSEAHTTKEAGAGAERLRECLQLVTEKDREIQGLRESLRVESAQLQGLQAANIELREDLGAASLVADGSKAEADTAGHLASKTAAQLTDATSRVAQLQGEAAQAAELLEDERGQHAEAQRLLESALATKELALASREAALDESEQSRFLAEQAAASSSSRASALEAELALAGAARLRLDEELAGLQAGELELAAARHDAKLKGDCVRHQQRMLEALRSNAETLVAVKTQSAERRWQQELAAAETDRRAAQHRERSHVLRQVLLAAAAAHAQKESARLGAAARKLSFWLAVAVAAARHHHVRRQQAEDALETSSFASCQSESASEADFGRQCEECAMHHSVADAALGQQRRLGRQLAAERLRYEALCGALRSETASGNSLLAQVKRLEQQRREAVQQCESGAREVNALRGHVTDMEAEVRSLRGGAQDRRRCVAELQGQRALSRDSVVFLGKQVSALETELEQLRADVVVALTALKTANESGAASRRALAAERDALASVSAEQERLQALCTDLDGELAATRTQAEQAAFEAAGRLRALETQLEVALGERAQGGEELARVEAERARLVKTCAALRADAADVRGRASVASQESSGRATALRAGIEEAETQRRQAAEEAAGLQAALALAEEKLLSCEADRADAAALRQRCALAEREGAAALATAESAVLAQAQQERRTDAAEAKLQQAVAVGDAARLRCQGLQEAVAGLRQREEAQVAEATKLRSALGAAEVHGRLLADAGGHLEAALEDVQKQALDSAVAAAALTADLAAARLAQRRLQGDVEARQAREEQLVENVDCLEARLALTELGEAQAARDAAAVRDLTASNLKAREAAQTAEARAAELALRLEVASAALGASEARGAALDVREEELAAAEEKLRLAEAELKQAESELSTLAGAHAALQSSHVRVLEEREEALVVAAKEQLEAQEQLRRALEAGTKLELDLAALAELARSSGEAEAAALRRLAAAEQGRAAEQARLDAAAGDMAEREDALREAASRQEKRVQELHKGEARLKKQVSHLQLRLATAEDQKAVTGRVQELSAQLRAQEHANKVLRKEYDNLAVQARQAQFPE